MEPFQNHQVVGVDNQTTASKQLYHSSWRGTLKTTTFIIRGVEIIEGEVCPDHIHMLVSIPPKMSVSGFMSYLKGKSALLIFQKWGNMKFAYRNREFWCKGYYVDTVGKNTKAINEYIADQLKRDQESDQLAIFDPRDPFMGGK